MTNLVLTLFLDGTMAILLLATIFYCGKLNKRIKILQDSKGELAEVIVEFDKATDRATASISEIHKATSRLSENLQHKLDKANYLADDLQFMIEKGSKMSGRADTAKPAPRSSKASDELDMEIASNNSRRGGGAEALAKTKIKTRRGKAQDAGDTKEDRKRAALESVLKKATGQESEEAEEAVAPGKRTRKPVARLRSKAEQELFQAMKTGSES